MTIFVDDREDAKVVQMLRKINNDVVVQRLQVGDYIILGRRNVIIERKTAHDFASSIRDGRIWSQLSNYSSFLDDGYVVILAIIGSLGKVSRLRKWNLYSLISTIAGIQIGYRISVLFFDTEKYFVLFLHSVARRYGTKDVKRRELVHQFAKKPKTVEEQVLFILESFPGISAKRARQIVEKFGSIKCFVNNYEKIVELPRVGEKLLNQLREVIEWDGRKK